MLKYIRTPEEERIYNKYGSSLGGIPMEYIEMFEEIDTILDKFDELICDYLEDLKAYALMYRNVHIKSNRVIDRIYFAKKAEEIKGYKNKIYSQNGNTRTQVLRYYLEYGALFELYCLKQVGVKMEQIYTGSRDIRESRNNYKITDLITIEEYNNVKRGQLGREFGVVSLSDEQCTTLLNNIGELETISTNNKYQIDSFPLYDDEMDFVKNIIIPYYYKENCWNLNRQSLNLYAQEKGKNLNNLPDSIFEEGKAIYQLYENINITYLSYRDEKINELQKRKEELLKPSHDLESLNTTFKTEVSIPTYSEFFVPFVWRPFGISDEEYRKKRREIEEKARIEWGKKRKFEQLRKQTSELMKAVNRQQLNTQIKENEPKIDNIDKEIISLRKQYKKEITTKYNAFIDKLSSLLFNNNSNVWNYMFKHQEELQEHFSSFYKNEYSKSLRSELKNSLLHSIDAFVQKKNMHNPTIGSSLERLYRKVGNESIHKREARTWATYIKELIKKREEHNRKVHEEEERKRLEKYRFNIRNKHENDSKITFRETDHVYIVDGIPFDSVTTFVKNSFPQFDAEFHAKRKAEALGITKEAVLEMWDKKGKDSREQGTAMHKKIESYYLGKEPSTDDTFELFKIFANKITLKPYRTEWAVYDWEQKIAGTIDFVDYQNGEYTIYDWKRSDKLIAKNGLPIKNSQYGEKALPPIENLDNSPYYHYALQLSLYKYILEKNYGITVSKLRLGIFHPSYNKPYVLEMPYMQNEIDTLFGLRSEVVF